MFLAFPSRQPEHTPCYPSANKPFIIMLDLRYQYAIIALSIERDSFVPCQPCAPAPKSF